MRLDVEAVRLAVYGAFRDRGRPPRVSELAVEFEADDAAILGALHQLATQRHVVLGDDGEIVMAHPFSAVPMGFAVMGRSTLWWGGCSWDSFAMAHLLTDEDDLLVATRCPGCGRAGAWVVNRTAAPVGEWLAHFLVPVAHMWDDVVHTCSNQRLFCSGDCIAAWCRRDDHDRGYVMDLETLWRLASRWYDGRLDRGYVRREPAAAAGYLRQVGLVDQFWGTA